MDEWSQSQPRSRSRTLPRVLQSFGVEHSHQSSPHLAERLRKTLYEDLVKGLAFDPFFEDPQQLDFDKPLRSQQGPEDDSEYSEAARGRPCGHFFAKGETVYRCRTCGIDDTCVMCAMCYQASNHEGHDIAISLNVGSGGCCDCGDKEAWKVEMCCRYHYSDAPVDEVIQPVVPDDIERNIRATVGVILDFVLDVMFHAQDSAKAPRIDDETSPVYNAARARFTARRYDPDIESDMETSWSTVLWNDERHVFDEVIDIVKRVRRLTREYGRQIAQLVDSRGRATVYTGNLKEAIRVATFLGKIKLGVTVRAARDVFREDMVEVLITFLQDIANLSIKLKDGAKNTALIRTIICEEMCSPWDQGVRDDDDDRPKASEQAVPMNDYSEDESTEGEGDDEQDNTEMIDVEDVAEALEVEPRMGQELLRRISRLSPEQRALLLETHNLARTEAGLPPQTAWPLLADAGNPTIVPNGQNRNREDLQVEIEVDGRTEVITLPNIFDGTAENFDRPETHDDFAEVPGNVEEATPTAFADRADAKPLHKKHTPAYWLTDHHRSEKPRKTRLTYLFLLDLRLWKAARTGLRELWITTMVALPYFKREMGIRFAIEYEQLARAFIFADREPEQSMILFSVQIFTVPSIALALIKEYDFLTTLLSVCYTYYSQHKIGGPRDIDTNALQTGDVYTFNKSTRHYHIVNDLRYLLCTSVVQEIIPSLPSIHLQFIDWLELFQGQNPQRQAHGLHVEYESIAWIDAFNDIMQISKHTQMFARTFEHARRTFDEKDELRSILTICVDRIRLWDLGCYRKARPRFEPRLSSSEHISFHHPLHWLLAGLSSHLTEMDDLKFLTPLAGNSNEILRVGKYPLRVLHMIWEIRCNLWVRNGHSIRHQLLHYTDVKSREHCVDKDIQVVQIFLATAGPSLRFGPDADPWVTMADPVNSYIEHFERHDVLVQEMMKIFKSVPPADYVGDDPNMIHMQDYMFHFFITLFTERSWFSRSSNEEYIARALRHGLVFGPKTYSDLSKFVNDDRRDETCFDRVVEELTDFRPPIGLEDAGKFELKKCEFDKVDPYFHHYTLQQIDEVNEILSKRENGQVSVAECKLDPLDRSPWNGIVDFVCCPTIQKYIVDYFTCLRRSATLDPRIATSRESVTDKILHLLLLVLQEEQGRRARGAITKNWGVFPLRCADYFLQNNIFKDPLLRPHHAKLNFIYKRLTQLNGETTGSPVHSPRSPNKRELESDDSGPEESEFARKKALAKARQAKLMSDMRASQNAFIDKNSSESFISDEENEMELDSDSGKTVWQFPAGNCIICQTAVATDGKTYGVLSGIQESRLDRTTAGSSNGLNGAHDIIAHPLTMDRQFDFVPSEVPIYPEYHSRSRTTVTTCGHIMHWTCYQNWVNAIKSQHQAMLEQGRNLPSRSEYQCPLCKTVGNTFMPIMSKSKEEVLVSSLKKHLTYEEGFLAECGDPYGIPKTEVRETAARLSRDMNVNQELVTFFEKASISAQTPIEVREPMKESVEERSSRRQCFEHFWTSQDEHSALPDDQDNYTVDGFTHVGYSKQIGVLTASIVDVEIALRDRAHNDNKTAPVTTLVEGMSEQNLISLRVQTNILQCSIAAALYEEYLSGFEDEFSDEMEFRIKTYWRRIYQAHDAHGLLRGDLFAVLVEYGITSLQPETDLNCLANTLLLAEMVKVVIFIHAELKQRPDMVDGTLLPKMSEEEWKGFYRWCRRVIDCYDPVTESSFAEGDEHIARALYGLMQRYALAFLRKYAIFAVVVCNVKFPVISDFEDQNELERLSSILDITPLLKLMHIDESSLASKKRLRTCQIWFRDAHKISRGFDISPLSHPLPFAFTQLPRSLDVLFERCRGYKCPNCKTTPNSPALCLLCGRIVCFQSRCCSSETTGLGECNTHRNECGGSIALYLLVKRCALMIMRREVGSFGPAPYLDIHGETDMDLRRGKPQFLSEKRYEGGVRQLYLQHQISTWLARKLESAADMGGWETL